MSTKTRKKLIIIGIGMFAVACFAIFFVIPELVWARYHTSSNSCLNHLRMIESGKQQWFLEHPDRTNYIPTQFDLQEYVSRNTNDPFPWCVAGGTYVIGGMGVNPRCTAGRAAWPMEHTIDDEPYYTWWDNFMNAYRVLFGLMPEPYTGRRR